MSKDPKFSGDSAAKSPDRPGDGRRGEAREERLAQALRDNLRKRKAQQRQRRQGFADLGAPDPGATDRDDA